MPSPLALIQRLTPAVAKTAERNMYGRVFNDIARRDKAMDQELYRLTAKYGDNQHAAMMSPRGREIEKAQRPLGIARTNMRNAHTLKDEALYDPRAENAELLLATGQRPDQHVASLLHGGQGVHPDDPFLPAGGVYIDGLSSEVPGGGTQLLKELESQYPGLPMYLQSLDHPATKEFYFKKGFFPQPENASTEIPRNLWIKPADVQIKKQGGLMKMKECSCGR